MVRLPIPPEPTRALPVLVVLNVGVFLAWQAAGLLGGPVLDVMATHFLVSLDHLRAGLFWTVLTSAFSQQAFGHLFFNMFALWLFGADVERLVGARGFVHLYVAGGILASLGHVAYGLVTGSPVPALGASGAVMAVAVVAAALFPRRTLLLFFVIPLPQVVAVGLFILFDVAGMISPTPDRIAHAAHLGGAVYGWLYWRLHLRHYVAERLRALARRQRYDDVWDHPWR